MMSILTLALTQIQTGIGLLADLVKGRLEHHFMNTYFESFMCLN